MKINKAILLAMTLCIIAIADAIYGILHYPEVFWGMIVIILLWGSMLFIFTDEFIGEVKACKRWKHGTLWKPTVAPEPKHKVPVPPKFKP